MSLLSSIFEHRTPQIPVVQAGERADGFDTPDSEFPVPPPQDDMEDLAQRVREIGEWQLEDW